MAICTGGAQQMSVCVCEAAAAGIHIRVFGVCMDGCMDVCVCVRICVQDMSIRDWPDKCDFSIAERMNSDEELQ